MTLACGNTSSVVEKLSTKGAFVQHWFGADAISVFSMRLSRISHGEGPAGFPQARLATPNPTDKKDAA